ncbi:MAG: PEP-CTERM sorting domain-containing protein, partial [Kiritimatiellaceae bacterium]|nr:PEP-CTERM sorting domain-containing protein [Kiritimatiellaceae bacterium]
AYNLGSQLNSTASSFGVNAPTTADQSSFMDTGAGKEAVWISFNHIVTVKSLSVGDFSPSNVETGAYQVANGALTHFTASGTYSGIDTVLNTGAFFKVMTVNTGGGNGWSLNSFTVTAIPEPATGMMLGAGSLALLLFRRWLYR